MSKDIKVFALKHQTLTTWPRPKQTYRQEEKKHPRHVLCLNLCCLEDAFLNGEMRYKKGGRSEKVICTYYWRTLENKDNTYAGLFTTPRLVECAAEIHQEEKWRLTDLEVAMHEKPCREKKGKAVTITWTHEISYKKKSPLITEPYET